MNSFGYAEAEFRGLRDKFSGRTAVAMSGGVDSSVAAAMLVEKGLEIVGVTMKLLPCAEFDNIPPETKNLCCSPKDSLDAREVCHRLGAPHIVVNLVNEFEELVIRPFIGEYRRGRTPNPCVLCNEYIKNKVLAARVKAFGAVGLATGHYARIETDPATGKKILLRPADRDKDQTYFLYPFDQEDLEFISFPLAGVTKKQTRILAGNYGLPTAAKDESNDVCFLINQGHEEFLREEIPEAFRPGEIVFADGRVIGRHEGLAAFTRGQRRGLRIAWSEPLYVLEIDVENNRLVVGTQHYLYQSELTASAVHWISGSPPEFPLRCAAKIRYLTPEASCTVYDKNGSPAESCVHVVFDEPQRAITRGQSIVFYDSKGGEVCLGGGRIENFA